MQVFPSLNPGRREDVVLLQSWLRDTMAQLTTEFRVKDTGSPQVRHALHDARRDHVYLWTGGFAASSVCCCDCPDPAGIAASEMPAARSISISGISVAR